MSRSAIVTPRPAIPESRTPGLGARATASRTSCEGTVAGKATRTGYTPFTPGVRSSSAIARGSRTAEKPLNVRVNRNSGLTITPSRPSWEMNCCCAATAADVQRRSSESPASPPARWTRSASEKAVRTTRTRWPVPTGTRAPPTSPLHAAAASRRDGAGGWLPPPAGTTTIAAATTPASAARQSALRHRIRVQAEGIGGGLGVAAGGGDHRGIVRAELERRGNRLGQRGAELGVGGDAADDRDRPSVGRLADAFDERPDDRALVGRGEVGAAGVEVAVCRGRRRAAPS